MRWGCRKCDFSVDEIQPVCRDENMSGCDLHQILPSVLNAGDKFIKKGGDYKFIGEVRAVFTKKSGAMRYVVENDDGILHIFSAANTQEPRLPMRVPVIWSIVLGINIAAAWIIATLVVAHFTEKYW